MSRSPSPFPFDPGLPIARQLLDAVAAGRFLGEQLPGNPVVSAVSFRYLEYTPGVRLIVQYRVTGDGETFEAGALATPDHLECFRYPDDPALPGLARPDELCRRLGIERCVPIRLAWVPGRRAALRFDSTVVKLYADRGEALVAHRRIVEAVGQIPTAALVAADVASGVVAQRLVTGHTLERNDAANAAGGAADLLAVLRRAEFPDLAPLDAADALAQADAPVKLVSFAVPELAERLAAVRAELVEQMPEGLERCPAHGDFNVGQLIIDQGALTLIDLDTLCAAPIAFDLAGYATNVVSGRSDDLAHLRSVLRALDDHGERPAAMAWFVAATLLRRVDRAARRLKGDWPQRTAELVRTIETMVAEID